MKSDLEMWKTSVESFNGKSMFLQDRFLTSDVLSLYTDPAAFFGYGAIYSSYWFMAHFSYSAVTTISHCWNNTQSF